MNINLRCARYVAAATIATFVIGGVSAAKAQFRLESLRVPEFRIEKPNHELQVAQECFEGADTMQQAMSCVARRLTFDEMEKCIHRQCWGENNVLRQLFEGRLSERIQDDFDRSDLGRVLGGDWSIRW